MKKAPLIILAIGISAVALLAGILSSCQKNEDVTGRTAVLDLPSTPYDYSLPDSTNNNIPTLGRVLFYDARLSVNNSISCSSCHKQALAFADNVSFSQGFEGKATFRNSMPIQNLVNAFPQIGGPTIDLLPGLPGPPPSAPLSLFWDGREKLLKAMVLRPITNHVEMGIDDLGALADKLASIPDYQILFTKAFGDPTVNQTRIADALSGFLSSIVANNTKFDRAGFTFGVNPQGSVLTALEQAGRDLFFGKYDCNSCHQTQMLNGYQQGGGDDSTRGFINIGLDKNYRDIGFADVSGRPSDIGKFKIPTLRNVALTAPYMHDGRFKTLDEVLNHYSEGIQDHPNLDLRLRTAQGAPRQMNISYHDKQAIIAFLNTLTDYKMITDPRFSNPFRVK